jgi:hypothetical protein
MREGMVEGEYQYYEFLALDRPLDARQQDEVRALSTRASINATSFVNEYHWGNFRGDPSRMMERYYDAHLYLANWGSRRIMFRFPRTLLDLDVAEQYCVSDQATAWTADEFLVLDLASEDDSGEWVEGAEGSLSAIVASVPRSPQATCGRSTSPGWPVMARGNATSTHSTANKTTNSNHQYRQDWQHSPHRNKHWPTSSASTTTCSTSPPPQAPRSRTLRMIPASSPDGSPT